MGGAGFFHGGTECEHAENHVKNSPLNGATRFLDVEAAREDDEDRGDKRQRGNGQHVKRSEHNHAENSGDRERRLVAAKRALCGFGETEEVALLHEPMDRFGRALHQQRVAKSQLDVLKVFPQVLTVAMDCQDEHAITLLEIEFMQRLAKESGAIPEDSFHQDALLFADGFETEVSFGLENQAGHFLNSFDAGDRALKKKLVAGDESQTV